MIERPTAIAGSAMVLFATILAGCVFEGDIPGTGTVLFCVQDDPTVNFNGVFINFGNIEIDQNTGGGAGDDPVATTGTGSATDNGTNATTNATTTATTTETTSTTATATTQTTETVGPTETMTGGEARTIRHDEVQCSTVFAGGFRIQQAYGNDRTADTNDAQTDDDEGRGNDDRGRVVEVEAPEVNVLEYKGGRAAFLGEAKLKPMVIHQVRFEVQDVRVVSSDGRELEVDVPSDEIRLNGPIEVREGHSTLVVLKVDVEQSFVMTGQGDRVIFKPVIHVHRSEPVSVKIEVNEAPGGETTSATMGNTTATTNMTATSSPTTAPTNTTAPAPTTSSPTTGP